MAVKESAIETELVRRVEAAGGIAEKVTVLGRRGFFDRLVVLPGLHLGGAKTGAICTPARVTFVECKRPRGGSFSAHQIQRHKVYRGLGVAVAIVKNLSDIDRLLGDS